MTVTHPGAMVSIPLDAKLVDVEGHRAWLSSRDTSEIVILDLETGAEVARRAFAGAQWLRRAGGHILLSGREAILVVSSDLAGDVRPLPCGSDATVLGASPNLVVVSVKHREEEVDRIRYRWECIAFELSSLRELHRGADASVRWSGLDASGTLLLGLRGTAVVAMRAADGTVVWTSSPFEGDVLDDLGDLRSSSSGDEILVRGATIDHRGSAWISARLDPRTGHLLGKRRSAADGRAWMAEVDEAVKREAARYDGTPWSWRDGAIVSSNDQVTILRPSPGGVRTQRLATPSMTGVSIDEDRIFGHAQIAGKTELVFFGIPTERDADELDLALEPRGAADSAVGDEATVTFVGTSAPFVVVEHPKHGRATLTLAPGQAMPKKGDRVVLEGVTVKPGNVVTVARWSLADQAVARDAARFELGEPKWSKTRVKAPLTIVGPLRKRATDAEIDLPAQVLRICERVEADDAFRSALATLSMDFDESELGLDLLEEVTENRPELEGFFPLWGNGHGDAVGGIAAGDEASAFVVVSLPDGKVRSAGSDFVSAIAHVMKRSDDKPATVAFVTSVLTEFGIP